MIMTTATSGTFESPAEIKGDAETSPAPDPRASFDVTGRVVVVTGGSRGLGRAICRGLAAAGALVVIVSRTAEGCESTVAAVRDGGGTALGIAADVARPEEHARIISAAVDEYGGIDVLVNNAGVSRRAPTDDVTPELYDEVHGLNARGAFFLARTAYPHLRVSGRGSVINVTSTGIHTGGAGSTLYRSSKSALHGLTMVLAREWAVDGIRANTLEPGAIEDGMGARLTPERVRDHVRQTPLGRLGLASELVPAVLFLASDASSFMTGATLRVDGGRVSE
jgi:NAD(P)-dependent dehydrogenase (short-subunit alcohol dehydrogenase family)